MSLNRMRTGTHGTISHGKVTIKGTLLAVVEENCPSLCDDHNYVEIEVDSGGGSIRFPRHWTWTEDAPPKNELKVGTKLLWHAYMPGRELILCRVVPGGSGMYGAWNGEPTHFFEKANSLVWEIDDFARKQFEDPKLYKVVD